jgi:hypothetical protein
VNAIKMNARKNRNIAFVAHQQLAGNPTRNARHKRSPQSVSTGDYTPFVGRSGYPGQILLLAWRPDSAVAAFPPFGIGRGSRLVVFVLGRMRWRARIEPEELVHVLLVLL